MTEKAWSPEEEAERNKRIDLRVKLGIALSEIKQVMHEVRESRPDIYCQLQSAAHKVAGSYDHL